MTTETTEISTQTQKQERMMPLLPTYGASGIPQEWQHPSYGFADSVSSMSPRDARQALGDRLTSYGITNALHIAEGIIRDEGATGFAYAEASERLKQAQTPERAVSPAEAILEEEREKWQKKSPDLPAYIFDQAISDGAFTASARFSSDPSNLSLHQVHELAAIQTALLLVGEQATARQGTE